MLTFRHASCGSPIKMHMYSSIEMHAVLGVIEIQIPNAFTQIYWNSIEAVKNTCGSSRGPTSSIPSTHTWLSATSKSSYSCSHFFSGFCGTVAAQMYTQTKHSLTNKQTK